MVGGDCRHCFFGHVCILTVQAHLYSSTCTVHHTRSNLKYCGTVIVYSSIWHRAMLTMYAYAEYVIAITSTPSTGVRQSRVVLDYCTPVYLIRSTPESGVLPVATRVLVCLSSVLKYQATSTHTVLDLPSANAVCIFSRATLLPVDYLCRYCR